MGHVWNGFVGKRYRQIRLTPGDLAELMVDREIIDKDWFVGDWN